MSFSFHRDQEAESPARLNRVLAQARRSHQQRQQELTPKELLATSRLELGLLGPRVLSEYLGRTFTRSH